MKPFNIIRLRQSGLSGPIAALGAPVLMSAFFLGLVLSLAQLISMIQPTAVLAQGGGNGLITHTTVADFGAACSVLPGSFPAPGLTNVSLSPVNGGELRLAATVEDYFEGSNVDSSLWLTGTVYEWYTVPPAVSGGVLTLDSAYLRSQAGFSGTTPVRFFETRALQRVNSYNAGWIDLGFYRELPPLAYGSGPFPSDSALRIFVTRDDNTTYVRGRDGDETAPLIDIDIPTLDLTQYHNFRIEWDQTQTKFYVDGSQQATMTGVSTLNTWAFLYHQTPTSLGFSAVQIDWVRAGAYPATGSYVSCVQDGGGIVNWTTLSAVSDLPAGTSATFQTRTSVDGSSWSSWTSVSDGTISSPSGRYFQYQVNLSTSDVTQSPEVQQVSLSYFGPDTVVVTPAPAILDPAAAQQFSAQAYDVNSRPVSSLNYSWQVVNGGGSINSSGLFIADLPAGTYVSTVQASTTGSGGTVNGFASVTVNNLPPVANAGGPYTGNEGQPVQLDGSASSDPNGATGLNFAWDLNYDGQYDNATVITPTYTWPDDGVFTIGLAVTDGSLTDTATTTVSIANLNPIIISITNTGPVDPGAPITVTVQAIDPGNDSLTYSFDWNNDGVYDIVDQTSNVATTILAGSGSFPVVVRVRDGDGGEVTGAITLHVNSRRTYLPIVFK